MLLALLMVLAGFAPVGTAAPPIVDFEYNGVTNAKAQDKTKPITEVRYTDFGGRKLTADEKETLIAKEELTTELILDETSSPSGQVAMAYATRCGTAAATYKGYNGSGHKLYEYRLNQYWCWNGSSVSGAQNPYVRVSITDMGAAAGWSFEGNTTAPFVNKQSTWYYRSFAQGHMRCSPFRVGTIQNSYPWVQIDSKGDGTYYATWGK